MHKKIVSRLTINRMWLSLLNPVMLFDVNGLQVYI